MRSTLVLLAGLCLVSTGCMARGSYRGPPAPCGPQYFPVALRRCIPQGFLGADFRCACQQHDACYDCSGRGREVCDDTFADDLASACDDSVWPGGCRMVSRMMHCAVALCGATSYQEGPAPTRSANATTSSYDR